VLSAFDRQPVWTTGLPPVMSILLIVPSGRNVTLALNPYFAAVHSRRLGRHCPNRLPLPMAENELLL
jgi:hypothetical protein